jgi:hypothetical protein
VTFDRDGLKEIEKTANNSLKPQSLGWRSEQD